MDVTAILPAHNERQNLAPLLEEIDRALEPTGRSYEVIVIDDGSTDGTCDELRDLARAHPCLKVLTFRLNYGQSAALDAGSPGAFYWTSNTSLTVDGGTIRAYESGHRRIFFIYAPLGRSPADDQAAGALEAGLTADGYHIVDQVRSSANSADTTILLFEAS